MQIICPKCAQAIPPTGVNVGENVAHCAVCAKNFALDVLLQGEPARVGKPALTKVTLIRERDRLDITVPPFGLRRVSCLFLVVCLFWNTILYLAIHQDLQMLIHDPNHWVDSTLPLLLKTPLVLFGLFLNLVVLYLLLGQTKIAIDRKSLIAKRVLFYGHIKRVFPVTKITGFRRSEVYEQNKTSMLGVGICMANESKPLAFGSHLTEEEQRWLISELHSFWKQVN